MAGLALGMTTHSHPGQTLTPPALDYKQVTA